MNQFFLRRFGGIKKKILIIGKDNFEEATFGNVDVKRMYDKIVNWDEFQDIDEIIITEFPEEKNMGLITCFAQKRHIDILFSPTCYLKILSDKINGNKSYHSFVTFVSRKKEAEEFAIRCLDFLGSMVLSLFSLPIIGIITILIKLTSVGPVIYKQQRFGKDGNIFILYKFRTMRHDAREDLTPAVENDPRITAVGKWLRLTRIDELPQLFNIIKGDMSLVGPRPENLYRVGKYKIFQELRLSVRPGLTGLAQIRKAYDLHPKHKIRYDYLYIQRRSLFLNLYILAKTVPVVLLRKGT
jgi:lipopolysaccharide/colanic/teichoic acid biosynthesis glycosyltransferase